MQAQTNCAQNANISGYLNHRVNIAKALEMGKEEEKVLTHCTAESRRTREMQSTRLSLFILLIPYYLFGY